MGILNPTNSLIHPLQTVHECSREACICHASLVTCD